MPAPALGDGVLALPLAEALLGRGHAVAIHHDMLRPLAPALPDVSFVARPAASSLAALDALFVGDPSDDLAQAAHPKQTLVLRKQDWDRSRPYLDTLRRCAARDLDVSVGDAVPAFDVAPRSRTETEPLVLVQAFSATPSKDWLAPRTAALVDAFHADDLDARVLLAPSQVERFRAEGSRDVPTLVEPRLMDVAAWIRASSLVVGPDSGIGHLASALGRPTLTLFAKQSRARFWRPAFEGAEVVLPRWRLPGARGSKGFATRITVARVRTRALRLLGRG